VSLSDWVEAKKKEIRILVRGEEVPPPAPGARGAPPRKPAPPPKEPPLSPRRLLIVLEAALLVWACWWLPRTWRVLLGGWPTRANFLPPRIVSYGTVRDLEAQGRDLWITGPANLTLLHEGQRIRPWERIHRRLPSRTVTAVLPLGTATWIGTARGLAYHDGKAMRRVPGRGAPGHVHVTCLAQDSRGRIWAGTAKDGVMVYDGKAWRRFRAELASPYVTAIAPAGKSGGVWVGLYAGGVVWTDGAKWTPCREPENLRGHPVRRLVVDGADSVLGLTDRGFSVISAQSWQTLAPKGWPEGDPPVDLVSLPRGRLIALTAKGTMLDFDRGRGSVSTVLPGRTATTVAGNAEALFFAEGGVVWRVIPGSAQPLTNWGMFFDPIGWFPPSADFPADWRDPRYRTVAGRLAASAILLAFALFTRAVRWGRTPGNHAWRIAPLHRASLGAMAMAAFYAGQWLSWKDRPLVATTANELALYPVVVIVALWCLFHWIRIVRYEWTLRRDAFWTGVALVLSGAGAWLWWVNGALVPSLIVCSVGGLVFARSLKGLSAGTWTGGSLAWGVVVLLFQQVALFPPLVFATLTWGKAALGMFPTNPVIGGFAAAPRWLEWAPDGLHALYMMPSPSGAGGVLELMDGTSLEWRTRRYPLPTSGVTPRFSPDTARVALCLPEGRDTLVECLGLDGTRRWRSRLQGTRVAGVQPWWEPSGRAMIALTAVAGGTQVWRLSVEKGDAVRLLDVPWKLAWPALSGDGKRLVCAVARGASPRLATISLADRKPLLITPAPPRRPLPLIYSPSEEGKALLSFLGRFRDRLRSALEWIRARTQQVAGFLGYRPALPELWINRPLWTPKPPVPGFRWSDYDVVREVAVSVDGGTIVCVVHRIGRTDELLYMNSDGSDVTVVYRSRGMLHSLRWAAFKNRMAVIEERWSALAPFPVRTLQLVTGLPESPGVRSFVPFAHWVSAPAFSVDGQRLMYAAPDRFWRISLAPADTFGFFEVSLESEIGAFSRPVQGSEQSL